MADPVAPLSARFPRPAPEAWEELARTVLKGRDPQAALARRTRDDIVRGPLHARADAPAGAPLDLSPIDRGGAPARTADNPWDIRTRIDAPDPKAANAAILADLEGGATSVEIALDPDGARGVAVRDLAGMAVLADGVLHDLAPLTLDARTATGPAAALLIAQRRAAGHDDATLATALNFDPLGRAADGGAPLQALDAAMDDAVAWGRWCVRRAPRATAFLADARTPAEAGASEAQAIGWALASGLAYIKALDAAGLDRDQAAAAVAVAVAAEADIPLTIATLRALRLTWTRMASACGVSPAAARPRLHAVSSQRMMASRDVWSNMLRTVAAGFGAAVGGCDGLTLAAFTDARGRPAPLARRIARNQQLLLAAETRAGAVDDPAAGSFHLERLTADLAAASWTVFQDIERTGGARAALETGAFAALAARSAEARRADIDAGRDTVIGVTAYPDLAERAADLAPAAPDFAPAPPAPDRPPSDDPDALIAFAAAGRDFGGGWLAPADPAAPLAPIRLAAPYEAVRDAAEAAGAPRVFLATLGAQARFGPRAGWARNLLASAGLAADPAAAFDGRDALVAAARADGARFAVLCADDEDLAADGVGAVEALAAAGLTVWVAAPPGPVGDPLRAAGAARLVHRGAPLLDTLQAALSAAAP